MPDAQRPAEGEAPGCVPAQRPAEGEAPDDSEEDLYNRQGSSSQNL